MFGSWNAYYRRGSEGYGQFLMPMLHLTSGVFNWWMLNYTSEFADSIDGYTAFGLHRDALGIAFEHTGIDMQRDI